MAIEGLLGNPFLSLGSGLLSVSGPSFQPQGIGQGLALGLQNMNQSQQALLQNRLVRSKLAAEKRKQQAAERLSGLLSGGGTGQVGPTNAAAAQVDAGVPAEAALAGGGGLLDAGGEITPEAMGLLAEIAPEQVAGGLINRQFASERAEPADIRTLRAIGIDPQSKEGRELIMQKFARGDMAAEQLDAILKTLNIEKIRADLAKEDREETMNRRRAEGAVLRSIDALSEMAELNADLEGTALETGAPFPEVRRAAAAGKDFLMEQFGLSSGKASDLAAKVDRFQKLATQEVIRAAEEAHLGGTFTNQQLQTFQAAKPGTSVRPEANRLVIADMLAESLRAADAAGINVKNRKEKEALLRRLRGQEQPRRTSPAQRSGRERSGSGGGRVIDFFDLPE